MTVSSNGSRPPPPLVRWTFTVYQGFRKVPHKVMVHAFMQYLAKGLHVTTGNVGFDEALVKVPPATVRSVRHRAIVDIPSTRIPLTPQTLEQVRVHFRTRFVEQGFGPTATCAVTTATTPPTIPGARSGADQHGLIINGQRV